MKSDSDGKSATLTTAIRGTAGDWPARLWVCVSALSILE